MFVAETSENYKRRRQNQDELEFVSTTKYFYYMEDNLDNFDMNIIIESCILICHY